MHFTCTSSNLVEGIHVVCFGTTVIKLRYETPATLALSQNTYQHALHEKNAPYWGMGSCRRSSTCHLVRGCSALLTHTHSFSASRGDDVRNPPPCGEGVLKAIKSSAATLSLHYSLLLPPPTDTKLKPAQREPTSDTSGVHSQYLTAWMSTPVFSRSVAQGQQQASAMMSRCPTCSMLLTAARLLV